MYHPAANGAVERFNRVLKDCIQAAIVQAAPWKKTVTAFLQTYRATPHATTGVSPFELLFGRKMRTKLAILPLPLCDSNDAGVRQHVSDRQHRIKAYCDKRRGARAPALKVGDKVRVKKQVHVFKGHPKFTDPVIIQRQVGPCTYGLSDGRLWHSSHLASVPDVEETAADQEGQGEVTGKTPPDQQGDDADEDPAPERHRTDRARSTRERRPPDWLKDFVT